MGRGGAVVRPYMIGKERAVIFLRAGDLMGDIDLSSHPSSFSSSFTFTFTLKYLKSIKKVSLVDPLTTSVEMSSSSQLEMLRPGMYSRGRLLNHLQTLLRALLFLHVIQIIKQLPRLA
jgi:hypothetical protein